MSKCSLLVTLFSRTPTNFSSSTERWSEARWLTRALAWSDLDNTRVWWILSGYDKSPTFGNSLTLKQKSFRGHQSTFLGCSLGRGAEGGQKHGARMGREQEKEHSGMILPRLCLINEVSTDWGFTVPNTVPGNGPHGEVGHEHRHVHTHTHPQRQHGVWFGLEVVRAPSRPKLSPVTCATLDKSAFGGLVDSTL